MAKKYYWICEECGDREESEIDFESITCTKCGVRYSRCTAKGKVITKK